MKSVFWLFTIFIVILVLAFISESEPEPDATFNEVRDNQRRVVGNLKWKSAPRWNIPSNTKDEAANKTLVEAILDDDVCAFMRNDEINDSEKLLQAYLTAISNQPTASTISVLSLHDMSQSLAGRFFRALRLAGMLDAQGNTLNPTEALNDLRQLESLDPENGAYPLFAAPILLELKYPIETQMKYYQRAFSKPRFDTFASDVAKALNESGRQSSTHFLAAQILLGEMPVPKYEEPQTLVSRFIDKDAGDFSKLALKFSDKILKNVQSETGNLEEYSYSMIEYQTVRSLYLRAYKKLYPGSINVPNYIDLMREPASLGRTVDHLMDALGPMQKAHECDRNRLDEVFYSWKQ